MGRLNLKKFPVDIILPGTPVSSAIGFTDILNSQQHYDTHLPPRFSEDIKPLPTYF